MSDGAPTGPAGLADRYRRWFRYEREMHAKVVDSLRTVPEAAREHERYGVAVDLLAHMVAARRLWLSRLGAGPVPQELFPAAVPLEQVERDLDAMHAAWARHLESVDGDALARDCTYRSTEGPWFVNTVEDILAQLFGHSWYHRGQIASIVRQLGGEPAVTDFVYWTRRAAGPDDDGRGESDPGRGAVT